MAEIYQATTKLDILHHLQVRGQVFILEQGVPWVEECTPDDLEATHFNARVGNQVVGAARLLGHKIGRVAVLAEFRGQGIGQQLMHAVEQHAQATGLGELALGAQLPVIPFYERMGYVAYGEVFLDAHIEHRMMRKTLNATLSKVPS